MRTLPLVLLGAVPLGGCSLFHDPALDENAEIRESTLSAPEIATRTEDAERLFGEPRSAEAVATVVELCETLSGHAPITMAVTKTALGALVDGSLESDEALLRRCYGSDDFHEGVAAFVAKRPPAWRGR